MGTHPPPQKGGRAAQFSAHVYCGQTAAWIKVPHGMEIGLGPDDIVLDGDPATTSPKRERSSLPQFSAHLYCGKKAGWIKMSRGVEVGLGPGRIVLDGVPGSAKGA